MSHSQFFQAPPVLNNQFLNDPWLQFHLQHSVPAEILSKWKSHLQQVGEDAAGKLLKLAAEAESQEPKHIPFDAWGNRIDELQVSGAWGHLQDYAAQHGLIAEGYERNFGSWSRVYQMALLYLYHPSSAIFSCPLAMTDGAARALELYGDENLKKTAFRNLISRDPKMFWTSGQWMTEKTGGSDVGLSLTTAKKTTDGYALTGDKWFTSATTSQMALTLARIEGAEAGGRGLSLFYVKTHDEEGRLQNIQINRLKEKMGTKALPTAELSLLGTPATLLAGEGGGIRKISTLFNITRIYNAVCSIGYMRRAIALALDYAGKRQVFEKSLKDQPLHVQTLFPLWAEAWGCSEFVFELVRLLGREECGEASEAEKALLRLYTPLAKLYTGKKVVGITSEILESFGGAGYVEDTGLPAIHRNAHVLSIWEGTTNVLSLDVLRALTKECPLNVWADDCRKKIQGLPTSVSQTLTDHLNQLLKGAQLLQSDTDAQSASAREFAFALTELSTAILLCQRAKTPQSEAVANFWVGRLKPFNPTSATEWQSRRSILF